MVSVAVATYNGEKYIREQLKSILDNLEQNDEVVISDDGSTDNTLKIVKEINDSRIRVIKGPGKGIKQNFANAIEQCKGEYIFLSDQDDYWYKNKVVTVCKAFRENNAILIEHDAKIVDANGKTMYSSFFEMRKVRPGVWKNLLRNTYHGCCIAFKQELVPYILPIPDDIYLHDQWIGILADYIGKTYFLKDKLINYRRHGNNASSFKHLPIRCQIKNRMTLLIRVLPRFFKCTIQKKKDKL